MEKEEGEEAEEEEEIEDEDEEEGIIIIMSTIIVISIMRRIRSTMERKEDITIKKIIIESISHMRIKEMSMITVNIIIKAPPLRKNPQRTKSNQLVL